MQCTLITPQREVATFENVSYIDLPGETGRFGVKPNHSPLIATLNAGEKTMITDTQGKTHTFTTGTGFVEVTGETVRILVQSVSE